VSSPSNAPERAGSVAGAPSRAAALAAPWVAALAILYPMALVVAWALLRFVGERWWMTGVTLYLPMLGFGAPLPVLVALILRVRRPRLLWTQALAAVILAFSLMGLVVNVPRFGSPAGPVVRVFSYNVDSEREGVDNILAEVERYSPDIAVFVEVSSGHTLEAPLKERFATVVANGQFLLATKYPVLSTRDPDRVQYYGHQRSPRYLEHVVDTPLGQVALYIVHPLSPRDDLGAIRGKTGLKQEILSGRVLHPAGGEVVQVNAGLRWAQTTAYATEASREKLPVIIAGDTNLPPLSYVFASELSNFQDGFREVGSGFGYTFPAKHPWMRIDRILASDPLRFVRFLVGQSRSSDHRSVIADLERTP
jgi:endonuclease/exonuclease/phosphatase (EEP) superfamily protein YafD